eukprot:g1718.t1
MDHTILSPSTMVAALDEEQKALLCAYVAYRNPHSPELMDIIEHIVRTEPTHLRLKELFESMEACRKIATFIVDLQKKGAGLTTIYDLASGHGLVGILLAYRFPRLSIICADRKRRAAFDTALAAFEACGEPPPPSRAAKPKASVVQNGGCSDGDSAQCDSAVGTSIGSFLAAAEFSSTDSVNNGDGGKHKDKDKSDSKTKTKSCPRRGGGTARARSRSVANQAATLLMPAPTASTPSCGSVVSVQLGITPSTESPAAAPKSAVLPNVSFVEGDFAALGALPHGSFVVSIHACNEANRLAIDMAKAANAAWAVMPCCIRDDLVSVASVRLRDDEEKYIVKCGIIAGSTNADKITSIDKRITNRHIMLMGCARHKNSI